MKVKLILLLLILMAPISNATTNALKFLEWRAPDLREDGTILLPEEVGGYELRGFNQLGIQIWATLIEDGKATRYNLLEPELIGVVKYQICVYDIVGLYSYWVDITPKTGEEPDTEAPLPPGQGWLE